MMSQDSNG